MGKKEKMTTSARDGVSYRRAKTWQIALSQMTGAAQMCFYALMTYATYIGNQNYGILVGVTGIIITASRILDSVTDPICAYIIERFNSKYGKIRIFLMLGWAIMAAATTLMCNLGAGHLDGAGGLLFFIVCYVIYIIGYTLVSIGGALPGNVMTNDPSQRPLLSVWNTIYSYLVPMFTMLFGMLVLLPKHDNIIGTGFLAEYNIFIVVMSLLFYILVCIGVTPYDKKENFEGISTEKEKTGFSDMWRLIRDNKELQYYMVSACSDKLAQTISSASVVNTLLYGIMVGSLSIGNTIQSIAMLPSIIFAIVGARIAAKHGNRKTMLQWTWACLGLNVLFAVFLLFTDTTQIATAMIPKGIFFLFMFGNGAFKMVVTTATNSMRMDIIDYEMYRTGKFMPATVSATYSFIDKLISSFGATIATLMIGLIGYTTTAPQQGDPLTMGVRIMTVLIVCGMPIIGWICTLAVMRRSKLTKEYMIEIQKGIADKKNA